MKNQLNSMVRAALLQSGNIVASNQTQQAFTRNTASKAESQAMAIAARKAELNMKAKTTKR